MARFVYEGKTNVYWLTTIATTSTPRLNEITAGTALTNFTAKDGVEVNINSNNVDSATIAEIFDAQVVGSYGADLQLTMFRDDATDTAWNTCVYGTNGYLVIDRFNASGTSPGNADKVEVWPAEMHVPSPENSAANTDVRFVEKFAVTSAPYLSATVTTATT
jgi:hypothetical protein